MESCNWCDREMERATADNTEKGLTWLWPDEKWICGHCLDYKKRMVNVSQ